MEAPIWGAPDRSFADGFRRVKYGFLTGCGRVWKTQGFQLSQKSDGVLAKRPEFFFAHGKHRS